MLVPELIEIRIIMIISIKTHWQQYLEIWLNSTPSNPHRDQSLKALVRDLMTSHLRIHSTMTKRT